MGDSDDAHLTELFLKYREFCPDIEPGANFMPDLWRKIEARRSFWSVFSQFGRIAAPVCAAMCLFLLLLNMTTVSETHPGPTYADALAADHTAEKTYYAEAIRTAGDGDFSPGTLDSGRSR